MRILFAPLAAVLRPAVSTSLVSRQLPAFVASANFFSTSSIISQAGEKFSSPDRKTTKHVLSRKTFLIDYYKHLNDTNEIVLYVHHNNLVKADNLKVRNEFQKLGVKMTYLRNSLYNVYLRSAHEEDPALHKNTIRNKNVVHPLSPLLNGPTAVITVPQCEPSVVEQVLKILKQSGEKLFLVGAKIEASVFNVEEVNQFKTLPNREQLQGQLAGLLTVLGGAGLVRTLESNGTLLYLTLDQRRKDLDPEESNE
ncbi:CIC11C00000003207 [Sungouiella intermedia]|uniref:CIC11C00000003207 n=1 Tax=Sungouiella intermedia TaxID=45354 RepID=A0A1L0BAJ2_9ASCO|nr:CIC11C00000003207 [[Candida] intermedia]